MKLGIDIGSVTAKAVVLDEADNIIESRYIRNHGQPVETMLSILEGILTKYPPDQFTTAAATGTGGSLIADLLDIPFVNEITSQAVGVTRFHPEVQTILEIGGEDSKLIVLEKENDGTTSKVADFAINGVCAAGTGSFLDQQAARLGLSIEGEFGELALKSKNPPRIAGRCSVFAKTDMIHLQQEATPDYDIVAGLCHALARNFHSNICRGKDFERPIAFQGGVAANAGMVRAFENVLELEPGELVIPEHFASMGAIGAGLTAVAQGAELGHSASLDALKAHIREHAALDEGMEMLELEEGRRYAERSKRNVIHKPDASKGKVRGYLGIDVGSLSTNVVVIDEERRVLSRRYLMTAGRPIEAAVFAALSLRTLSMRPASIGPVKHLIRRVDLGALRRVIDDARASGAQSVRPSVVEFLYKPHNAA